MTLFSLVSETFADASDTDLGRRLFGEVADDCLELSITDGEDIHILFQNETATAEQGPVPEDREAHTISGSEEAFRELFDGRTRIVDAAWNGRIQAEVYHGRPDLYFALQQSIKISVPTLEPEPF